jgi:hypothetical protein
MAKATFETMMNAIAQPTMPGPAHASATVPMTQVTVETASRRFFAACASTHAPTIGPSNITMRYDTDSAAVHANVPHGALPVTTATKYALNTAVSTTVV